MNVQKFDLSVQHDSEVEVSGKDLREWLAKAVDAKFTYRGFAVASMDKYQPDVLTGNLYLEHPEEVNQKELEALLSAEASEKFKIVQVEKC